MSDGVESGWDVPHSQHGTFSSRRPATTSASSPPPAPASSSSKLCWRFPSHPVMRSLAVAESRPHGRRRVGNSGQGDSGNVRVCRVVGRSMESLGSVLQDHGIVTMVVPTEVSTQTEPFLVIVSAARPLGSRSVARCLVPGRSAVSRPPTSQYVLQGPPPPLDVER